MDLQKPMPNLQEMIMILFLELSSLSILLKRKRLMQQKERVEAITRIL